MLKGMDKQYHVNNNHNVNTLHDKINQKSQIKLYPVKKLVLWKKEHYVRCIKIWT